MSRASRLPAVAHTGALAFCGLLAVIELSRIQMRAPAGDFWLAVLATGVVGPHEHADRSVTVEVGCELTSPMGRVEHVVQQAAPWLHHLLAEAGDQLGVMVLLGEHAGDQRHPERSLDPRVKAPELRDQVGTGVPGLVNLATCSHVGQGGRELALAAGGEADR